MIRKCQINWNGTFFYQIKFIKIVIIAIVNKKERLKAPKVSKISVLELVLV